MGRRKTTEEFISEAKAKHGEKYDYSKVEYKNSTTKICITCPEHGEFWQVPSSHLNGQGCPACGIIKNNQNNKEKIVFSTETFIEKAKEIHGDKYDYSKTEYINSYTNVLIICPEHGEFRQLPGVHLKSKGCQRCFGMSTEKFIEKAKEKHGDKYDYSKTEYKKPEEKVLIICPDHGPFYQYYGNHLKGSGCPTCGNIRTGQKRRKKLTVLDIFMSIKKEKDEEKKNAQRKKRQEKKVTTTEKFIKKAKKVHGNKYDYSKTKYTGSNNKVLIICPEHGEFYQRASTHLEGKGCKKCGKIKAGTGKQSQITTDEFIKRSKSVHGNKYDYSKSKYIKGTLKTCIICPEHGEFWQEPVSHMRGHGCPQCGQKNRILNRGSISKVLYTPEGFIAKAKETHGDKYDYSKTEYINNETDVVIICPIHGEFTQRPNYHIKGKGCPECKKENKIDYKNLTTEELINIAKEIHGSKYDYSKVKYIDSKTKVCIICPEHGEFQQYLYDHLTKGKICPTCSTQNKSVTKESFLKRAKEIHDNKYDYSKVKYKGFSKKVCIVCPEHGDFWQTPNNHLQGTGCPDCATEARRDTKESFIEKANSVHGNKYDYSKVNYVNSSTKVCIICPEHGEFWQAPGTHLNGSGCTECSIENRKITTEEFIEKAIKAHGDKYDYSKSEYTGYKEKICIVCPEHGEFWQDPANHLSGSGCPTCIQSRGEEAVEQVLKKHNIEYVTQQTFEDCKDTILLRYDFGIYFNNQIKGLIEYNGEQHYKPQEHFGGKKSFADRVRKDRIKANYAKENNIPLLVIPYNTKIGVEKEIENFLKKIS